MALVLDVCLGLDALIWLSARSQLNQQMITATSSVRGHAAPAIESLFVAHRDEIVEHIGTCQRMAGWLGWPNYAPGLEDIDHTVPAGDPRRVELLLNAFDFPTVKRWAVGMSAWIDNRRQDPRRLLEPPLRATLVDEFRSIACEVGDVSACGAQIRLRGEEDLQSLPWVKGTRLRLQMFGVDHPVDVRWPRYRSLGVRFVQSDPAH